MGLIKNKNLEPVPGGSKYGPFSEVSRIINTVVTCGIDFDHVKRAAAVS
jgi:hypothetical protein